MYPWAFFWAPHLYFPLSGSVAQDIDMSWFFDSIEPNAGDGRIEKRAFEIASYGRQLGLITEVLIDLANKVGTASEEAGISLRRLMDIKDAIDQIKDIDAATQMREIESRVETLKHTHKTSYPQLRAQIERSLGEDGH